MGLSHSWISILTCPGGAQAPQLDPEALHQVQEHKLGSFWPLHQFDHWLALFLRAITWPFFDTIFSWVTGKNTKYLDTRYYKLILLQVSFLVAAAVVPVLTGRSADHWARDKLKPFWFPLTRKRELWLAIFVLVQLSSVVSPTVMTCCPGFETHILFSWITFDSLSICCGTHLPDFLHYVIPALNISHSVFISVS